MSGWKPCPFAHDVSDLFVAWDLYGAAWFVTCAACGTRGPVVLADTREGGEALAKEAWNRQAPDPLAEELARAVEALGDEATGNNRARSDRVKRALRAWREAHPREEEQP